MSAPKDNQFARKEDPKTSVLLLRVTPAEKAGVVKAARGEKLSVWMRRKLGMETG